MDERTDQRMDELDGLVDPNNTTSRHTTTHCTQYILSVTAAIHTPHQGLNDFHAMVTMTTTTYIIMIIKKNMLNDGTLIIF